MFEYQENGNKKGFTLIFFHGFLGNMFDWKYIIPKLADNYFCISINIPGHGKSPITNQTSFDSFAEDFLKFIKVKKIEKLALIGYSMGGRIAKYIQSHYLKQGLCICIGAHLGLIDKNEIKQRKMWSLSIRNHLINLPISDFLNFWYSQKIFDGFRNSDAFPAALKKRLKNNNESIEKAFSAFCITKQKLLSKDNMTHFIVGQNDIKYLEYYQKIKCTYHIVENSSHVVHLENPKGLVIKLKEILHGIN